MHELYADGGVLKHNPSTYGGMWAFQIVEDGVVTQRKSGVITPEQAKVKEISNNLTEMLAVLSGLSALPRLWDGTIYSDSRITLGRLSEGFKWNGIPAWMHEMYRCNAARLVYYNRFKFVLLAGHPTKAQLLAGIGRHGYPVSPHNVDCDKACTKAGKEFMEMMRPPERRNGKTH